MSLAAVALLPTSPAGAVIGGQDDGSAHPYVGGLDASPVAPFSTATGVLISPTVFLTPAHATVRYERAGLTQARVTFDPVATASSTWYTGTIHTDPLYDPTNTPDRNDLGVIVFATPIPGITPASLPGAGLLDQLGSKQLSRARMKVVGYGLSRELDFTSSGTRKVANEIFGSLTSAWLRLRLKDGAELCLGDSGSPSLLNDSNVVAGITIGPTSINGGQCESQPWDQRVDTPEARASWGST